MEEKPISTLGTKGIGCLVAVGACIIVIILWLRLADFYTFPFIFAYSLLAYPFGYLGALIGKNLAKTRMGLWIGAMLGVVLELGLLLGNLRYFILSD